MEESPSPGSADTRSQIRRLVQRGGADIDPIGYSADGQSFRFEAPPRSVEADLFVPTE